MSRGRDITDARDERLEIQSDSLSLGHAGGSPTHDLHRSRPRPVERRRTGLPLEQRRREEIVVRGRSFSLRNSHLEALNDIGRFRSVAESDLARYRYGGDSSSMEHDLRDLARQGLVTRRTFSTSGEPLSAVALTKDGQRLVRELADPFGAQEQALYSGFVKPAEIPHDVAIYRMYQAEAAEIEAAGGQVQRVVLDYELKKRVYSPLARAQAASPREREQLQREVARENGLQVIEGEIPLPDLRIEYLAASGERGYVDLELATEHYRASQLATKARAGFKIYSASSGTAGASVRDEREITADILTL